MRVDVCQQEGVLPSGAVGCVGTQANDFLPQRCCFHNKYCRWGVDGRSLVKQSCLQHLGSLPLDWFTLYRQRKLAAKRFLPTGIVLRYDGPTVIAHSGVHRQYWESDTHTLGTDCEG